MAGLVVAAPGRGSERWLPCEGPRWDRVRPQVVEALRQVGWVQRQRAGEMRRWAAEVWRLVAWPRWWTA